MLRTFLGFLIGILFAGSAGVGSLWWTAKQQDTPFPPRWIAEWTRGERPVGGAVEESTPLPVKTGEVGVATRQLGGRTPAVRQEVRTKYGTKYALFIGINAYTSENPLEFAYNDARAVREALREFGYEDENVRFFSADFASEADRAAKRPSPVGETDGLADRATLQKALFSADGWLAQLNEGLKPEDSFFFFYAGHGDEKGEIGFLLPLDADASQPDEVIPLPLLKQTLGGLNCRHKGVVLDACFSGSLFVEPELSESDLQLYAALTRSSTGSLESPGASLETVSVDPEADEELAYYFSQNAFLGLCAGRNTPVADGGGEQNHSIFTHNLLSVLEKRADSARPDHAFTFREMAMMVERQVRKEVQENASLKGIGQIPRFGYLGSSGDGDLIFQESAEEEIERERKLADEGRKWLEIAEASPLPARQIFAAKALGFVGYGRLRDASEDRLFRIENPVCFDARFHQEDIDRARELIEGSSLEFRPKLYWSSPGGSADGSVAWSPEGTRLASGSKNGTIRLWDPARGEQLGAPLTGHEDYVSSVAWSPDGTRLASASKDGTIRLWDPARGEQLGEPLTGHENYVLRVAWSPEGTRLASSSKDGTIRLWNAQSGEPIGEPLEGHDGEVYSVAWSPEGTRLASASRDKTIRLWDVARGEPIGAPLAGHGDAVNSVVWSPDGTRLASASWDGTIRLWDVARGEQLGAPLTGHEIYVVSVAWSPDGTRLASASWDGTIRLWDVVRGEQVGASLVGHENRIESVAWSPEGTRLASASVDGTIRLWEVARGEQVGAPLAGHGNYVSSVAWSPEGTRLASASDDKTIRLWDVGRGEQLGEPLAGHENHVLSVAWSPEGTRLASASVDRTIRLWDVARGEQLGKPLEGHGARVEFVAWSPEGTRLASASRDKTIRLWDVARGEQIGEPLTGHEDYVWSVSWSPEGTRLASASYDKTIRLWDVARGEPIGEPLAGHEDYVVSVAWSPEGTRLLSASEDGTIRLWDVARGEQLGAPLAGHGSGVICVAWSPDGTRFASASRDKTIRLWDVGRGEQIGEPLAGHGERVCSVAWSPEGTRLASASYDKTIRVWETQRRVFDVEYRLDLTRYFRDGWCRFSPNKRFVDWFADEDRAFGFRLDVLSRGSITHLLRETRGQPDRHRKLLHHLLHHRCWKPAWIWWERLLENEWEDLSKEQRMEAVSPMFEAFYALAKTPRTDAPAGWYEARLQGLWQNHQEWVRSDLEAFPEWTLMSFVQGIAGREAPCGLEELALASLDHLRRKVRADGREPDAGWDQWEEVLRSHLPSQEFPA